jgi:hypothetical protein
MVFVPFHAHRRIHISGLVTHFVFGVLPGWLAWCGVLAMWRARQLSRGCVGDGLAFSYPLGTSRWSRLVFKERQGSHPARGVAAAMGKQYVSVLTRVNTPPYYFFGGRKKTRSSAGLGGGQRAFSYQIYRLQPPF